MTAHSAHPSNFAQRLIAWQRHHGRHDLPWQGTRDPYRVWLSEIMLQQTQVAAVIPYYQRFLDRFPDIASLAAAPADDVMARWSGLGYYARARNLHQCAQALVREHGNVKRLLCRHAGIAGWPGAPAVESQLWQHAESLLPQTRADIHIQAQMDLGATVCTRTRPRCEVCPVAGDCVARRDGRTAELPTPKPRKALPERAATVLILVHDGRVLLEVRPPSGIWGGLWSLPEVAPDAHADAARLGCRIVASRPLAPVAHAFTHFRLTLRPLLCQAEPLASAAEPTHRWVRLGELESAPLPAPIRKLLEAALSGSP